MTTAERDAWNAMVRVGDIVQRNVEGHWVDWWEIRKPDEMEYAHELRTGRYQHRHRIVRVVR